jgi:hypothetical protein
VARDWRRPTLKNLCVISWSGCCGSRYPVGSLADLPGLRIDIVHERRQPRVTVLDIYSSESPTYSEQEGSAYNGHFGCTRYHPPFVFNQFGDLERCALRSGDVHSATGRLDVVEPIVAATGTVKQLYFPEICAFPRNREHRLCEAATSRPTTSCRAI